MMFCLFYFEQNDENNLEKTTRESYMYSSFTEVVVVGSDG